MHLPAATKQGGMAQAFPDLCKTPAGPSVIVVPYPNFADLRSCDDTSSKVLIANKETVVVRSFVPRSRGDEAGTLKGVVSGTQMDRCSFKKGSAKVFAEGHAVVFHTAPTAHNGTNANAPLGCLTTQSQSKVFVAL